MRIGIYNPYLDSLAGGERYLLSVASKLSHDHEVHIFWDDSSILERAQKKLGIDTSRLAVVPNIWIARKTFRKLAVSKTYDRIVFLSDGSIPLSFAKKTYIHFQFPVPWVEGGSVVHRFKTRRIDGFVCNSKFVKRYIDKTFDVKSAVIYPGIDSKAFKPGKKTNTILSVGRFTHGMNTKKQDVMIDAFKTFTEGKKSSWKLVLAGSVIDSDEGIIPSLKRQAKGYPIEIKPNVPFSALCSMYAKARVYWHAAGFGEDLETHPEKAEHFGISIVESMASGCVPIVFQGGGPAEIVVTKKSGLFWETPEELVKETKRVIASTSLEKKLTRGAIDRASDFEDQKSVEQFVKLLK